MEYALTLTLCELQSADIKVPKECQFISQDPRYNSRDVKQCVKKLSKSAQTWTSYSGYFRDVVLICFAIRYPMEKEILQKLHVNITLNQLRNFNILQQQQEYLINWRNEEFKTLRKLKESQVELLSQMGAIQGLHTKSESQIQNIYTSLVSLQDQTQVVINKYNGLVQHHVDQMQDQLSQLVRRQEYELGKVVGTVIQGLQAIDRNIEDMVKIQQDALETWSNTRNVQEEYLDFWRDSMHSIHDNLSHVLNKSLDSVHHLHSEIETIHDQVKFIAAPIQWTSQVFFVLLYGLKRVALNTFIQIAFFYHLTCLFQHYEQPKQIILLVACSIAHQYLTSYLFSWVDSEFDVPLKILLIFIEWTAKEMWITRKSTFITFLPEHADNEDMLPKIHIPRFINMTLPENFTENIAKSPSGHKKLHFHRYYSHA
ncbi:hypothetical protein INT47_000254 [Mucor saturninus]|uniref:Uncharacterized protein n=1 Tax=Mucor saturninus TaxID=64648 RepID=A0A8H7QKI3_9FUNG|nr:hypothetical protein INT47_000254 [Mucor saturninus]